MAGKLTGAEVQVPVDGCVTNWDEEVQVHAETGQRFDFQGRLIEENKPEEVKPEVEKQPKGKRGK